MRTKRSKEDPGDYNHRILFYQESYSEGLDGSQKVTLTLVPGLPILGLWAKKTIIKDFNQMAIQAGATIENDDCFFTIRSMKSFYPGKAMLVRSVRTGDWFNIASVQELQDPAFHVRIVAIRKDKYAPYITGDTIYYGATSSVPASIDGLTGISFTEKVTLNTGTSATAFSIVLKQGRVIEKVTDLDAFPGTEDLTAQYVKRGEIVIGDETYNVFSMITAIPYSSAHRHLIDLL